MMGYTFSEANLLFFLKVMCLFRASGAHYIAVGIIVTIVAFHELLFQLCICWWGKGTVALC